MARAVYHALFPSAFPFAFHSPMLGVFLTRLSVEKERAKNTIAIMAAILLLPKLKEMEGPGVKRGSPLWVARIADAISLAEEIYRAVGKS